MAGSFPPIQNFHVFLAAPGLTILSRPAVVRSSPQKVATMLRRWIVWLLAWLLSGWSSHIGGGKRRCDAHQGQGCGFWLPPV
jgi:hypothetical protein